MSMQKHTILGVHITDRVQHVDPVQHALTEFGNCIRTRLGLHELNEAFSSPNGLLILEMAGDQACHEQLANKLNSIEGVEVQKMIFDHP